MEKAYNFLQTTFLGLIAGVLIVLLLMLNYWANDIKITLRKSIVYQNNEYVKQNLEKYLKQRPSCKVPNTPKKEGFRDRPYTHLIQNVDQHKFITSKIVLEIQI